MPGFLAELPPHSAPEVPSQEPSGRLGAWGLAGRVRSSCGSEGRTGGVPGTTLVSEEVKFDSSVMNTQPANF